VTPSGFEEHGEELAALAPVQPLAIAGAGA
jgi:hypothetical protein